VSKQLEIQQKLSAAQRLIYEAGQLADDEGTEITFLGLVFEPNFGWFSPDGELQQESNWNSSACVIGSRYAEGYGMEGWKDRSPDPSRWDHPNK
jgi:hypothetical protein